MDVFSKFKGIYRPDYKIVYYYCDKHGKLIRKYNSDIIGVKS